MWNWALIVIATSNNIIVNNTFLFINKQYVIRF